MHPNRSSRRVHSAEFKSQVLLECRQPGASVSAVAIAHGLNTNVVRKWLAGHNIKRMGVDSTTKVSVEQAASSLQFVPVELAQPERVVALPAVASDIRIELERGGLHLKLQCTVTAASVYAVQLRALADALGAK